MAIHHNFRKGQRVFVKLKTGEVKILKFSGKRSKSLEFEGEKIRIKDIRFITIYWCGYISSCIRS